MTGRVCDFLLAPFNRAALAFASDLDNPPNLPSCLAASFITQW